MSEHLIELRRVSKSFPSNGMPPLSVLENVSFSVGAGQFCSILGPSGCGKTTLLRIIAGVETRDDGDIVVGTPGRRSTVSMVCQQDDLLPWLTIQTNLELALKNRGYGRKERAAAARHHLERVGLGEFGRYYPAQLSGGMQKRVSLARALAADADIVLFDEPLAFLDFQTRTTLQGLIEEIFLRHGKTMLYVTHDIHEAVRLSQDIVILTSQPARVRERIRVGFAYPRDLEGLRKREGYYELVDGLKTILDQEAQKTQELERRKILEGGA